MPPIIQSLLDQYGSGRKLAILGVGIAAIAGLWLVARWAMAPAWVPLISAAPLEVVSEVTGRLGEARVDFRLERGGTEVRVPERDLARARVLLAEQGLPGGGRPGFELFDQPSWGMTDFAQRVNHRRALEGELERTIAQMRGIESAQVRLALNETSLFRRPDQPVQASVFLRLRTGNRPNAEMVDAVTFLVASSVDGLTSENVTVLDDSGRVLSAATEAGGAGSVPQRQLAAQREVESYLEARAEALVAEVVGAQNVRIRVAATLGFDRVDRTIQAVDPEQQTILREARSEVAPGPNAQGATVEQLSYEVTRRIERHVSGVGELKRLSVAVLVNDRSDETGVPTGGPTADQLARVEALVKNAVGLDERRGDGIYVASIPFTRPPAMEPAAPADPGIWPLLASLARPAATVLTLLLSFVLALKVLRALQQAPAAPRPSAIQPAAESAGRIAAVPALEPRPPVRQAPPEPHPGTALVADRPEQASYVIRAWLKDG